MGLYQAILGRPFVYNRLRPLVEGGIDTGPVYERLASGPSDTLLDIGCGTGDALNHVSSFAEYVGFDVDEVAIRFARKHHGGRRGVTYEVRRCERSDIERIDPTLILMSGLLHHLSDQEAIDLLASAKVARRLRRIVTLDIVFLPGEHVSNFLARLDRGRHCRSEEEYERLVERAGLTLVEEAIVRSHPTHGRAKYLIMTIAKKAA
jgi:SAM-dependent methyltransferase